MRIIRFYFWVTFILSGCTDKKIDITRDYIVNPYSVLSQVELLEKLEDDTSFLFFANVTFDGRKYSDRKVYFNKNNGFFGGQIKAKLKQKG